jgi:hypothetical protein
LYKTQLLGRVNRAENVELAWQAMRVARACCWAVWPRRALWCCFGVLCIPCCAEPDVPQCADLLLLLMLLLLRCCLQAKILEDKVEAAQQQLSESAREAVAIKGELSAERDAANHFRVRAQELKV